MYRSNPIYHQDEQMLNEEFHWIKKAQQHPRYFAPLYKKYHNQIFGYVYHKIDDRQTAGDVTSMIFLKAINNIKKFQFRGVPLAAWLYRIAKNEVNQCFRDKSNHRWVNIEDFLVATNEPHFFEETVQPEIEKLRYTLSQLSSEDLEMIKMRYFEGLRYREMGKSLSITENNAKVKTFRALNKLRAFYNDK